MISSADSVSDNEGRDIRRGAVVLCGGRSSRMGFDKATLPFGPELMLQRVVRLLSEVIDPAAIVIVSASGQVLPQLPSAVNITHDERPERGPLEGIAAGLRAISAEVDAVYVTSCDVPLLVPAFVTRMFACLEDYEIAVPCDGPYQHPLTAVYRPRVLAAVLNLLAADRLRMRDLFQLVKTNEVAVESLRAFDAMLATLINVNCPEDYKSALATAGFSQ